MAVTIESIDRSVSGIADASLIRNPNRDSVTAGVPIQSAPLRAQPDVSCGRKRGEEEPAVGRTQFLGTRAKKPEPLAQSKRHLPLERARFDGFNVDAISRPACRPWIPLARKIDP